MRAKTFIFLLSVILSLTATGQTIFQKQYFNPTMENDAWNVLKGVIGLPDGGFMISAVSTESNSGDPTLVKTDDNGNVQWAKSYAAEEDQQLIRTIRCANGDFLMAGYYRLLPSGATRLILVMRVNSSGTLLWSKKWEVVSAGSTNQSANDIVELSDGSILVGGESTSSLYAPLVKLNSSGSVIWSMH
jgi:hypothetical protein